MSGRESSAMKYEYLVLQDELGGTHTVNRAKIVHQQNQGKLSSAGQCWTVP